MLASLFFWPTAGWAVGFQPVNPDELKMTSEPLAPGAHAIILYRQVDRVDDLHIPHEDSYLRIKILTEEGRNRANVQLFYDKEFEHVVNVHARTIRPNGSIADFDGKVFEKAVVKSRGNVVMAKTFTLPDVEVGSIIEYFYTVDLKENYVYNSRWILSEDLFTREARFTLKPYSGYGETTLRWTWQSLPPGANPQMTPGHTVEMDARNIPAFQTEDYMPPENELKARVDFIYLQEVPDKDVDRFWQRVGKKWNDYLEGFVGKRDAMQAAVGQIVSPGDAPEVKLRKIYDRVQQLRNLSYEVEKTEQEEKREKEKPPANVEDVLKRGYAYGTQLTWLYLGLVRAAGFEAYGCWVANRREYFFQYKLEKTHELDSNVVLVKLNGKDLYLDPGSKFAPFGILPWAETGVPGLQLTKDGGKWIQTTLPNSNESQVYRDAKFKLSDSGDLEGQVTVTYTGIAGMNQRQRERHEDDTARKKHLEDALQEFIPSASEVELTNQPDWTSSEKPLVAVLNVKIPGWAAGAGKRALFPVGLFTANEKHVFEHTDRVHPVYFEYPYERLDEATIELPLGWQAASVPAEENQDAKLLRYNLKVENNGSTLRVVRRLDVDLMLVPADKYPLLRKFFQLVRTGDEQQIVLQPNTVSSGN